MGIFSWLFPASPSERSRKLGFGRASADAVHIAPGRGYTTEVVGESKHQENLDAIAGGKCEKSCNLKVSAQLVLDGGNRYDPNAVGVFIGGKAVGYIPRGAAAWMRLDILRINPEGRPTTCDAKIVGGWLRGDDEGAYGVKLSISNPMRLR